MCTGEKFTVLSGDWRNGLGKKDRMKLNRKQSTITVETDQAGQCPAAPEKRGGSQAMPKLVTSCCHRQSHL